MNIYEKLSMIQQELIAPKNQYNSFGDYKYRSCEDILEGLKPCLQKTKTAVTISDELVLIGERYYIKATATIFDCEGEGNVSNTAYAREIESRPKMDVSQITGSASSYARKYALNGLFAIDDVKDADSRDNSKNEPEKKAVEQKKPAQPKAEADEQKKAEEEQKKIENSKISEVKLKALLKRCADDHVDTKKLMQLYKVNSLADLTERQFANIHEFWEKIKG